MGILDLVFPKTCLRCGCSGRYLCQTCIDKTPRVDAICPYCKHPSIDGTTHINCQKKFGIDGLTTIWGYEGVIRKAILSLKYKYATEVGNEISDYLISSLGSRVMPSVQYLAPVPIHWHRQNTRGFNQSAEIGKLVAASMGWKFTQDLLIKTVSTVSQTELDRKDRRQNLRGVFSVNPLYKSSLANLKSVIIFDDVFTTGSTLMEASKVLKRGGIEKVWGLTIAR